jgi:alkanesulfonate monooxygenase SsuD/methylene tetrahydromethanopterin reductase-like flavin-dependent oxidoreductase (luciferase family)
MAIVEEATATHLIGEPEAVRDGLLQLHQRTNADEIMLSTRAHSYETRLRSLSLVAQAWGLRGPAGSA